MSVPCHPRCHWRRKDANEIGYGIDDVSSEETAVDPERLRYAMDSLLVVHLQYAISVLNEIFSPLQ